MTNENKESKLEKKENLVMGAYKFGKKLFHYHPIFKGLCYFGAFAVTPFIIGTAILSSNKQIQQQNLYRNEFKTLDKNKDYVLDSAEFIYRNSDQNH